MCVDGSHIRAKKEGRRDRSVAGRLAANTICDGKGTPLHVITTAANVNDITQTLALVAASGRWPGVRAVPAGAPSQSWATRRTTPG
ncbi:transposase [Streptomyces sp. NPDC056910]|uniref:transposase n=1 Tax=Streptomyces sp. NPDC056910 TaxID=3345964 RepID=UPI0036B7095F